MNEHYSYERPTSKLKTKSVSSIIRGERVELVLASGTFSSKAIDKGSRILAKYMSVNDNDTVLDLGCGTGFIGLVASRLTKNEVVLTDINKRAVEIARKNTSGVKNIIVLQGDMYGPVKSKKFNVILVNLPQNAGRKVCDKMILESKNHLKPRGKLQVVERHNRGGKHFEDLMREFFGNLEVLAKKGGFWVCSSRLS